MIGPKISCQNVQIYEHPREKHDFMFDSPFPPVILLLPKSAVVIELGIILVFQCELMSYKRK